MLKAIVEPAGDQRLERNIVHRRQCLANFPIGSVPRTWADPLSQPVDVGDMATLPLVTENRM